MQYFKISEFDCTETGENNMDKNFLLLLDELRGKCGFPFIVSSGFRSPNHSKEITKKTPGTHSQGIAADIVITSASKRYTFIQQALALGFKGIGIHKSFIHVDTRSNSVIWLYE